MVNEYALQVPSLLAAITGALFVRHFILVKNYYQYIDTAISAMGITFTPPGILTSVGLAFNPILASIAGGALAVAQVLRARNKAHEEALKGCDYSWLYRVEQEMNPTSLLDDISERAARIWQR